MEFQKNDVVTVTIEDMGSEGQGIGKVDGFTLFVKDAVLGDTVEARIVKNKKNYAYARLEKVVAPSPFRVEPKCAYHRQCGGCQLQALSYEKQLAFKQDKIRNSLIRIGGFAPEYVDERMEPIVGMEAADRRDSRGKAEIFAGERTIREVAGEGVTGEGATRGEVVGEEAAGERIAKEGAVGERAEGEETACQGNPPGKTAAFTDDRVPAADPAAPVRYRNKAQYPIGTDKNGNIIAGFYAGRTHTIIANTNCLLGAEENEAVLNCVLDYMRENHVSAYDETSGTGLVRHVLIRKGFASGEIMVCLVINYRGKFKRTGRPGKTGRLGETEKTEKLSGLEPLRTIVRQFLPKQEELISELIKIKGMTSVSVSVNTQQTNVIMGQEIHTIWGRDTISDTIHMRDMRQPGYPCIGEGLVFQISPLSFYQVNPVQTEKLYSLALEFAGLTGKETVWDLYCGIGTISLFLASHAKKVCGVEVVPQAIQDARENAERNGIKNAEFFVGKAEDVLQEFYGDKGMPGEQTESKDSRNGDCHETRRGQLEAPDIVVVDPPRKGCDGECLEAILKVKPERIVYVSCDPATLARDLRVLCDGGYELEKVRGVDQFGMTVHVETVCLLSKLHDAKTV